MKFKLHLFILLLLPASIASAQWQPTNTSASDNTSIYHLGGNVGIGTNTPGFPLEIKINQTNTSAGTSANFPLSLANTSATPNSMVGIQFKPTVGATAAAGTFGFQFTTPATNYGRFFFSTRGSDGALERMTITENGKIGIGTPIPDAQTTIIGKGINTALSLSKEGTAAGESVELLRFNAPGTSGTSMFNVASIIAQTNGSNSTGSVLVIRPIDKNGMGYSTGLALKAGGAVGIGTTAPVNELDVMSPFADGEETTLYVGQDHNFGASTGRYGIGLSFLHSNGTASGSVAYLNTWFSNSQRRMMSFDYLGNVGIDGQLGIGTSSPLNKLDVMTPFLDNSETSMFVGQDHNSGASTGRYGIGLAFEHIDGTSPGKKFYLNTWFGNTKSHAITFDYLGNIGMGTSSPDTKLTVKGVIHTNEVRVDVNSPIEVGDYVFEKNYNLLTLPEVESYINENKHLPEVPSANQMVDEGLNLKEMNLLLLKKVEELTLYVIGLKNENIEQQKKLSNQQQQIDTILKKN
jgi:hypothetical protein